MSLPLTVRYLNGGRHFTGKASSEGGFVCYHQTTSLTYRLERRGEEGRGGEGRVGEGRGGEGRGGEGMEMERGKITSLLVDGRIL